MLRRVPGLCISRRFVVPQIPNLLKCLKEDSFVSGSSHAVDSHHLGNKARTKMATQIS